jgi:hypothetical protein
VFSVLRSIFGITVLLGVAVFMAVNTHSATLGIDRVVSAEQFQALILERYKLDIPTFCGKRNIQITKSVTNSHHGAALEFSSLWWTRDFVVTLPINSNAGRTSSPDRWRVDIYGITLSCVGAECTCPEWPVTGRYACSLNKDRVKNCTPA